MFAATTQLLWFHEFLRGGPEHEDNVYGSFNKVAVRVYMINFLLTIAGFGLDGSSHPVALSTNGVTLIFGALVSYLVQQNIDSHFEELQRYDDEVSARNAEKTPAGDEDQEEADL